MKSFDQTTRVELKYCERCGGLWLRRAMSGSTFCDPCEQAEVLMPMKQARAPRNGIRNDYGIGAMVALGATVADGIVSGLAADGRQA